MWNKIAMFCLVVGSILLLIAMLALSSKGSKFLSHWNDDPKQEVNDKLYGIVGKNDLLSLSKCRDDGLITTARFQKVGHDQILVLNCGSPRYEKKP